MWCDTDVHNAATSYEIAKLNALGAILSYSYFNKAKIKLLRPRYWVEWVPTERKWFLYS